MKHKLEVSVLGEVARPPLWLGRAEPVDCCGESWWERLGEVRGPFAVIHEADDKLRCAVDSIASIPLFYASRNGLVLVSDSATDTAKRIGARVSEADAREFLETGYVTDEGTLYEGVSAVLPGEVLEIDLATGAVERSQYLDYAYCGGSVYDEAGLVDGFEAVLLDVFGSLVERLGGRTVVLPLSGGCDSRTVAAMLRRVGYEDVLCFSYGRRGNSETATSKLVAEALGYQWEYVEYTGAMWDALIGSPEYGRFLDYACRGKSIACLQPLPAMFELSRRGLLPEGSVVVPGHTLDVEMGSHLPHMRAEEEWGRGKLVDFIAKSHYILGLHGVESERLRAYGDDQPERFSRDGVMQAVMDWEWRNRQARFIANDVRAYEYVGCGYELPFWDPRVMRFLSRLPYEGLYGRRLQYAFMRSIVDPACGIAQEYPEPASSSALKGALKAVMPTLVSVVRANRARAERPRRVLADYDWMSRDELEAFEYLYGPQFNINSLVADGTLQRVRAQADSWLKDQKGQHYGS